MNYSNTDLYPELLSGNFNSISDMLKDDFMHAFKVLGYEHSDIVAEITNNYTDFVNLKYNKKFLSISRAVNERLFMTSLWKNGVSIGRINTPHKDLFALAITDWLFNDWNYIEFNKKYPFACFGEKAFFLESGKMVEHAWDIYMSLIPKHFPKLTSFVKAARKDSILKNLYPFMSHDRFCFSRCTGYPYSNDCPFVYSHEDGEFTVCEPDTTIVSKGNVCNAIKTVKKHLPKNCKRAITGTKEDLYK